MTKFNIGVILFCPTSWDILDCRKWLERFLCKSEWDMLSIKMVEKTECGKEVSMIEPTKPLIYLASPYSTGEKYTQKEYYWLAVAAITWLIKEGYSVWSPIVHCHCLATEHNMPKDSEFWWEYNKAFVFRTSEVWVLKVEGWDKSIGVQQEIKQAKEWGITVKYVVPQTFPKFGYDIVGT